MCGGGGGGDDSARIRFEDSQEEADIARQVAELNAIFGNTEYDYQGKAPAPMIEYGGQYLERDAAGTRLQEMIAERDLINTQYGGQRPASLRGWYSESEGSSDDYYVAQDRLRELDREIAALQPLYDETAFDYEALLSQAGENQAARKEQLWGDEGLFSTLQDRYTSEIDRQRDEGLDDLKIMLARRGAVGSDFESEAFRKLGELYDENVLNWGERATSHVRNVEAQDENIRNQLRADIEAGGSLDSRYAIRSLESNLGNVRQAAFDENLANLFAGLGSLYGQQRDVEAYNRGYYGGANVGAPSTGGSTGDIVRY